MKVALRDDDTSYFTPPETLERVYKGVWDQVPVSLAVVPFEIGYRRRGIPERHWHSGEAFPLEANGELTAFLRERAGEGKVSILLHGYHHQDYPDGFEFEVGEDLDRKAREGAACLERLLGARVRTFVPPHNALSRRGLRAVSRARLNVLGSFLSFRPRYRPLEWRTPVNYLRVWRYRRRTGRTRRDPMVLPFALRWARHAEFGCHLLIPGTTLEGLKAGFEEARRFGGDFCLATHHWEVDDAMGGILADFLTYAAGRHGVTFVHADRLFE